MGLVISQNFRAEVWTLRQPAPPSSAVICWEYLNAALMLNRRYMKLSLPYQPFVSKENRAHFTPEPFAICEIIDWGRITFKYCLAALSTPLYRATSPIWLADVSSAGAPCLTWKWAPYLERYLPREKAGKMNSHQSHGHIKCFICSVGRASLSKGIIWAKLYF